MGIVYRAKDRRLKRLVAIKLLPPELAFRSEIKTRFLREAETAAQLSHPNIVPIYSVDERDGLVYFVMALVEGPTLAKKMYEDGQISAEETRRVMREVADALAYAHARGVIHRDIKPDNILLDKESGRAMVTDFGIARAIQEGSDSRLTATGVAIGTPAFMSPEQAAGDREIDGRTDLYALGVVAYQNALGAAPVPGVDNRVHADEADHRASNAGGPASLGLPGGPRGYRDVAAREGAGESRAERGGAVACTVGRRDRDSGGDGIVATAAHVIAELGAASLRHRALVAAAGVAHRHLELLSGDERGHRALDGARGAKVPRQLRNVRVRQRGHRHRIDFRPRGFLRGHRVLVDGDGVQVFEALERRLRLARRVPSAARPPPRRSRRRDDRGGAWALRQGAPGDASSAARVASANAALGPAVAAASGRHRYESRRHGAVSRHRAARRAGSRRDSCAW